MRESFFRAALALVLASAAPAAVAAEIYGWVDEKGAWHFVDDPRLVPERYRPGAKGGGDKALAGGSGSVSVVQRGSPSVPARPVRAAAEDEPYAEQAPPPPPPRPPPLHRGEPGYIQIRPDGSVIDPNAPKEPPQTPHRRRPPSQIASPERPARGPDAPPEARTPEERVRALEARRERLVERVDLLEQGYGDGVMLEARPGEQENRLERAYQEIDRIDAQLEGAKQGKGLPMVEEREED